MIKRPPRSYILDLITIRVHIPPINKENDLEPTLEMTIVDQLPNLEKNQFSKLQEDVLRLNIPIEKALEDLDFHFEFKSDIANVLSAKTSRNIQTTENFAIITCYYTLGWVYAASNERKDSDFECLIDLLNRATYPEMRGIVGFCFEKILKAAISQSNGIDWLQTSIQPVIVHFYTNKYLESSCFNIFVQFLQLVSLKGYETSTIASQLLLEQIIGEDRPLIKTNNISPLILYLQPFISQLNMNCIKSLCLLSSRNPSQQVVDTFVVLASSFVGKLSSCQKKCVITDSVKEEDIGTGRFNMYSEIVENNEMNRGFQQPPYESINTEGTTLQSFLNNDCYNFAVEMCERLKHASQEARDAYLNTLMHLAISHTNSTLISSIVTTILVTFKSKANPLLLKVMLPALTNSFPMTHKITIFGEEPIHPWINLIRNEIIDLIGDIDNKQIIDVLINEKSHPLFITELLVRIMKNGKYPLDLFVTNQMLNLIIRSAIQLVNLSFPKKYECRSANFAFIFSMLDDTKIAAQCFSNNCFIPNFLSFAFETDMMETINVSMRNCLSRFTKEDSKVNIEPTVIYLTAVIDKCIENSSNELYIRLIHQIIDALKNAICEQCWLALEFSSLLYKFLEFIDYQPDACILEGSLQLLAAISRSTTHFVLEKRLFEKFVKAIRLVDKNEPSKSTKGMFSSLLSGYSALPPKTKYYIQVPSFVPLVIAVYGLSNSLIDILIALKELCDYSSFNCRQLHDGDLDYILLKYIIQKKERATIFYRDVEITINMTYEEVKAYVLPLIEEISLAKSSNAITSLLANFVSKDVDEKNYYICTYLSQLLNKCIATPTPAFSLCVSSESQFEVSGIVGKDLNSGFSITLRMYGDILPLIASNASITLLTIKDENESSLRLFTTCGKIYVEHEANYLLTTVHVVRQLRPKEWNFFTFVFSLGDNVTIKTYVNGQSQNESNLCGFLFNPSKLTITCGGMSSLPESQEWDDVQMGIFGDVEIYTECFDPKDVKCITSRPWLFKKKPIFTTKCIKSAGVAKDIVIPRDPVEDGYLFGGFIDKIVVKVFNCLKPSQNILDSMASGELCNILANYFKQENSNEEYPGMIFSLISRIFKRSVEAQRKFTEVNSILSNLYKHQYLNVPDLYFSVYETFLSITSPTLKREWFDKLVFNICLWIHSSYSEFFAILTHWYTVVIPNFQKILTMSSYFSSLLTQFKMIFCFSKEDSEIKSLDDVITEIGETKSHFFNDTYSVESIFKCRRLFSKIIRRIAFSNFSEKDIPTIFKHLSTSTTKVTQKEILQLITDISSAILGVSTNLQKWISVLHLYVKSKDIDIIEKAVEAIHELSKQSISIHAQTIAMEITGKELRSEIFHRLLVKLGDFPNLYRTLCIIAMDLGKEAIDDLAVNLKHVLRSTNKELTPNWFVWPIILAFHATGESIYHITSFVASMLNCSRNINSEITEIVYFVIFMQYITPKVEIRYDKLFISEISSKITETSIEALPALYSCIFTTAFYHLHWKYHTTPLINELNKSPYAPIHYNNEEKYVFLLQFHEIVQVEQIADYDTNMLNIGYEVLLDENEEWIDKDLAMLALGLKKKFGSHGATEYVNALMYFIQKSSLKPEMIAHNTRFMFTYNEEQRVKYEQNIREVIKSILQKLNDLFETSRKFKDTNIDDLINNLKQESEILINGSHDSSLKLLLAEAPPTNVFVPDKTFCFAFCPMKNKRITAKRLPVQRKLNEASLTCKCSLINYKHTVAAVFNLYKECIVLSSRCSQKLIEFSQITHIFSRQAGNNPYDTMIEIFMTNGRSYLIDFGTFDVSNILKLFQKSMFPQIKLLWPLKQKFFFQTLPFTQEWVEGSMSTFEYLMLINTFAGRTFNNPDMFPIFPSIVVDINTISYICDFATKTKITQDLTINAVSSDCNINPRLYFDTSITGPLPDWAADNYDFIYRLRKLLESDSTSRLIPMWIDNIFGAKMKKEMTHKQVFKAPHPTRNIITNPVMKNASRLLQSQMSDIYYIASFKLPQNKYALIFVLNNGVVTYFEAEISKDLNVEFLYTIDTIPLTKNSTFSASNKGFVLYTPEENKVFILRKERVEFSIPLFIETNIFAYTKHAFLFCPNNCTVSYIDEFDKNKSHKVLCYSSSRITKLAASSRFKIFAYGTVDGYVSVHNLRSGNLVNRVFVGGEPEHLLITRNWGFVVATTSTKISVISVNGELIRESDIEVPIRSIYEFELNGFDYIAFERIDHRLSFFEAIKPEMRLVFFESHEPVQIINYDEYTEAFFVVTNESIKVVPHKII